MLKTFMSKKQPEIELLLYCARTHLDSETSERIHSLSQNGIDWEYLVKIAIRHRVMPLLYRNLKKICPQTVPAVTMKQLQRYFLVNAARNHRLVHELLKILATLEQKEIIAVPFKGPVLAENIYGDLALRQFADLDILVRRRDVPNTHKLLISLGYRPGVELRIDQFMAYIETEYGISYANNDARVNVDLHWNMIGKYSSFPFCLDNIKAPETTTFEGKEIFHLSSEDLLLYLCLHGSKHCWTVLENICSVADLIRSNPAMDWMLVTKKAKKMHCERILFLGLFLAHDLFDISIPGHLLKKIEADSAIKKIADEIYEAIFHENDNLSGNSRNSDFSSFHMKVRDRLTEKARYGLFLTLKPTREDWRKFPLPASLSFLHYLLRPIRLIRGFAESLVKRSYRNNRESIL